MKSAGAGVDSNGVRYTAIRREGLLKLVYKSPEDELARIEHGIDSGSQLPSDALNLGFQVEKGNGMQVQLYRQAACGARRFRLSCVNT
jgi:hypothetical protein